MAEALYRKYRPQVFEDVVGQEPIERTLKNAIDKGKVSHAYLFTGPRGTGKTTTARLLAKALLCQQGPTPDPDGVCEDCQLIAEGAHPDVYELDAASRTGVENVREEIISRVSFAPTRGRYKVYIIDEVHMLSTAAFNALLKTLEEPPSHVVFVLCTTDPQKVPETIHSRCQRFDFRRIAPETMVSRLGAICIAENVEFEGEALDLIAHRAEGGLRNALTSLEQIIAFENGSVTLAGAERLLGSIDSNDMAEIIAYVGKRDIANCFRWTAEYVETGADLAQFVRDMAEHVRNLYVMALVGEDVALEIAESSRLELVGELQWFGEDRLARLLGVLGELAAELKTSSNPRLAFEIALTRMVRPDSDLTLAALAERVEALESGYSAVAHVPSGAFREDGAAQAGYLAGWDAGARVAHAAPGGSGGSDMPDPLGAGSRQQAAGRPCEPSNAPADSTTAGRPAASPGLADAGAAIGAGSASGDAGLAGRQTPSGSPQAEGGAFAGDGKMVALANPATLQRIWQVALSALKKQKQSYGVLFMNTKARFDESRGVVRVAFPAESTFAFSAVQKQDVQQALASALEKAAGMPVPFAFEQMADRNAPKDDPGASPSAPAAFSTSERFDRGARGEAAPDAAARRQPGEEPSPEPAAASGAVSDGAVPREPDSYAEAPYDYVPYEEIGGYSEPPAMDGQVPEPVHDDAGPAELRAVPAPGPEQGADASTAASPEGRGPKLGPDGSIEEDPSDVESLLRAGFGGGVVFTEVDD